VPEARREPEGLFGGIFARAGGVGDEQWLQAMLDVEAGLARALERAGLAPEGSGAAVTEAARADGFDATELGRLAVQTGNPVPALVRALTRKLPPSLGTAVHRGATSQDILDSAAMLLAKRSTGTILADLKAAAEAAARHAASHRDTIMIGRTLLQQAVPVTFGLVAAGWLTSLDEAREGLARVREQRLAVQFGGAAGTLASLDDVQRGVWGGRPPGPCPPRGVLGGAERRPPRPALRVAGLLAGELGLALPVMPWHTDRLRIVELAGALAGAAAALGKIARDVTLLAQSEIGEVREGSAGSAGPGSAGPGSAGPGSAGPGSAGPGRGGSSTMPHKRNPVAAIAILGCTKRVPGLVATLAAAAEQELQRAAGGWHAEWEPLGDLLRLTGSAASWGGELLAGLDIDAGRMRANLDAAAGLPLAESVAALLAWGGTVPPGDTPDSDGPRAPAEGIAWGGTVPLGDTPDSDGPRLPAADIASGLGRLDALDLVAEASARAVSDGMSLRDALLTSADVTRRLDAAGITPAQVEAALDPAGYLGAAGEFIDGALAAHRDLEARLAR